MIRNIFLCAIMLLASLISFAQTTENTGSNPKWDYQIYMPQNTKEVKEVTELYYTSTHQPVNGKLAPNGKTIIIKNYEPKTPVHVKVIYLDGSVEEFTSTSCFIDPVI